MPINSGMMSNNSDEWATPQDLYNRLDAEFNFVLDPCATDENHKCSRYLTKHENGLIADWALYGGAVFCNPPYSQLERWLKKGHEESLKMDRVVRPNGKHGEYFPVVMLIPSRTDTKAWHKYVMSAEEIRLIEGRLKFGDSKNSAPFPSALVIFRRELGGGCTDIRPFVSSYKNRG